MISNTLSLLSREIFHRDTLWWVSRVITWRRISSNFDLNSCMLWTTCQSLNVPNPVTCTRTKSISSRPCVPVENPIKFLTARLSSLKIHQIGFRCFLSRKIWYVPLQCSCGVACQISKILASGIPTPDKWHCKSSLSFMVVNWAPVAPLEDMVSLRWGLDE